MSEPVQLAKAAREQLSAALNALQTNAQVPEDLMALADPIADAMSVLHRVERSNGADLAGRDSALQSVRFALDGLQKISTNHPATDIVMEHVAMSLAKVHALAKYQPPAAAPAPQGAPQNPMGPRGTQMIPAQGTPQQQPQPPSFAAPQPQQAAFQQQAPFAPPQQAPFVPPQQAFVPPQPAAQARPTPEPAPQPRAVPQPAPQQAYAPPAQPQQNQYVPAQPVQANPYAPAQQPQQNPYAAPAQPAVQAPTASSRPGPSAGKGIDVELGTHSVSNFYKGLGGNDVIEHGGIFVATYKVPKIGVTVALRILLPGDLEFLANAVVQWTRDAGGAGESAEPGFGARFVQITPEGRQLVYRYTRNREPIFYDDL